MSAPTKPPGKILGHQLPRRPERTPFFTTENPDDPVAQAHRALRRAEFELFRVYSEDDCLAYTDIDTELACISESTGMTKNQADKAVAAYMVLRDLPLLRELQRETHRLDLLRLLTISDRVAEFGKQVPEEVYALIDATLVTLFTPTKPNQHMPKITGITMCINRILADYDTAAAYDPKKRREREERGAAAKPIAPGHCEVSFHNGRAGLGTSGMTMMADIATMAATKAFIDVTARKHGLSHADAVLKLLTGDIAPEPGAQITAYAPKAGDGSIDVTKSVFMPGFGWATADGTAMFHHMAGTDGPSADRAPVIVDLDKAATHSVSGYVAPDRIRSVVRGRDGTCIYPGCTRGAWACQLDHRIPYDEGGRTEAANLFSLCQHHHNTKTDRRAFYVPDPVTGDIVWLFADGSYAIARPEGFIGSQVTAVSPKWGQSLEQAVDLKRKKAHFMAKGHKLLDDYDATGNHTECLSALDALEKEYDLTFPFEPVPLPPEPDEPDD